MIENTKAMKQVDKANIPTTPTAASFSLVPVSLVAVLMSVVAAWCVHSIKLNNIKPFAVLNEAGGSLRPTLSYYCATSTRRRG
jgi:hypothetical protein